MFKRRTLPFTLAIVALTLGCYIQVTSHQFVQYDDTLYVTENQWVQAGLTGIGIDWAWNNWFAANWHPLTWVAYMAQYQAWGWNPGMFAVTNVLFHIANALLLFGLLLRMTKRRIASGFVALIFAVHPLNVEGVAWVAQMKTVMCVFATLGSMHLWLFWLTSRRWYAYAGSLSLFVVGLLFKPMFVTMAAILLLLDIWPLQRLRWRHKVPEWKSVLKLSLEKLPFFCTALPAAFLAVVAQEAGGAVSDTALLPLYLRFKNVAVSYWTYAGQAILPHDHAVLYPFSFEISEFVAWTAATALLVSVVWVISQVKRRPWLTFGWFFYLGCFLPMIGIVQVGAQSHADRYFYVPGIGLLVIVVWAIDSSVKWRGIGRRLMTASLIVLSIACWRQVGAWRDSETIFRQTLHHTEGNAIIDVNLSCYLLKEALGTESDYAQRGKHPIQWTDKGLEMLAEARQLLEAAAATGRHPGMVALNHGILEYAQGDYHAAEKYFALVAKNEVPLHYEGYIGQALALVELKDFEGALDAYLNAVAVRQFRRIKLLPLPGGDPLEAVRCHFTALTKEHPESASAWMRLGQARLVGGDRTGAERLFDKAVTADPNQKGRVLVFVGILDAIEGRLSEAEKKFKQATSIESSRKLAEQNLAGLAHQQSTATNQIQPEDTIWTLAARKLERYL